MSKVNQLEQQFEANKSLIEKRDLALKLSQNREFKKLILDGFCTEECARFAQLSADPSLRAEERADSLGMAQAAGHLRRFLSVTIRMGNKAEDDNASIEEALPEMRLEEEAEAAQALADQQAGVTDEDEE